MRAIALICLATLTLLSSTGAAQSTRPKPRGTAKPAPEPALPQVALPAEPGEYAVIYTSAGNIVCRLFRSEAPNTVSNFVGLAKGAKTWTDPSTGKAMHKPLYNGTIFHRVIPGFMIQGGDPQGTGEGSPGYKFDDEIPPNRHFEKAGVLAMANAGPNTNGSQFFITVAPTPHLEGHYSIFGEVVSGQDVADAISQAPRDESNDKPLTPVKIIQIAVRTIRPEPAKSPSPKP